MVIGNPQNQNPFTLEECPKLLGNLGAMSIFHRQNNVRDTPSVFKPERFVQSHGHEYAVWIIDIALPVRVNKANDGCW